MFIIYHTTGIFHICRGMAGRGRLVARWRRPRLVLLSLLLVLVLLALLSTLSEVSSVLPHQFASSLPLVFF